MTVAATKKFGSYDKLLTIGRVQTPTLNLVVEREKAIISHKKTPYWKLTSAFSSSSVTFEADYEKGNFTDESEANAVLAECEGKTGIVTSVETEHKTKSAPLLFNTTQLLIAASKTFNWDSEKTSKIMQSLYDKKFMSYPRTSTEHLTDAMRSEVTLTIQKLPNTQNTALINGLPLANVTLTTVKSAAIRRSYQRLMCLTISMISAKMKNSFTICLQNRLSE